RAGLAFFERLGVDGQARDLREFFYDAIFHGGGDVVHMGDDQRAFHGAVAGRKNVVLNLAVTDIVATDQLVVFGGQRVQELLDGLRKQPHFGDSAFGRGDVAA